MARMGLAGNGAADPDLEPGEEELDPVVTARLGARQPRQREHGRAARPGDQGPPREGMGRRSSLTTATTVTLFSRLSCVFAFSVHALMCVSICHSPGPSHWTWFRDVFGLTPSLGCVAAESAGRVEKGPRGGGGAGSRQGGSAGCEADAGGARLDAGGGGQGAPDPDHGAGGEDSERRLGASCGQEPTRASHRGQGGLAAIRGRCACVYADESSASSHQGC